jgi:predicted O-methyltransferase YrrM
VIDQTAAKVIDELEAFQKTVDNAWNVPREEGMILHNIVLSAGCRYLVEVGTSYGFSGLFLASAARANGGRLHTFDIDEDKHIRARQTFVRAGVQDVVELHTGDARKTLPELDDGVDFAFLDATKDQTLAYWEQLEPKLADRCVITADNTADQYDRMRPFVELLHERVDFTTCLVQVGNGFAFAVRTG